MEHNGIEQVEANENMMKLKEMGRSYVLANDGKYPTAHIKESNKTLFGNFFKLYSQVLN